MKKTFILVSLLALGTAAMAQSNDNITVKKGKVTMTQEHYDALMAQMEKMKQENAALQKEIVSCGEQLNEAKKHGGKGVALRTFNDSASYAIGQDILRSWTNNKLGIDGNAAAQGMMDMQSGNLRLSVPQMQMLLQRFQQQFDERQAGQMGNTIAEGKAYMEQNANNKSVFTTKSGLQYQCLKKGNGKKPQVGQTVEVHYTGTLINGKKFDSSLDRNQPFTFVVGAHQVIQGWDEGLQLMEVGSKYRFVIPHNLAYGERAVGDIPAGSTLIFEVELLSIK